MARKLTKEDFLLRFKKTHGDKYDYSLMEYKNRDTKIKIICPKHGVFEQTPHNHQNGQGCPKCGRESAKQNIAYTLNDFLKVSKLKHGDKYDYSKVNYINSQSKVCIICPEHGEFWQKANNHMRGMGCKKCAIKDNVIRQRNNIQNFIEKSKIVHGDKYDYSESVYVNLKTKIKIKCPIHGYFWQLPQNHLKGWGCKKCSQSHLEKEVSNSLKENNINFVQEKTFPWLKHQNSMYLDFYLNDYNIAIECQGEQHFTIVDFSGHNFKRAEQFYKLIKKRDELKKKLCDKHGIEILYFSKFPHEKMITTTNKLIDEIKKRG